MNEALKQFTEELKAQLVAAISTKEIQDFVAKTLEAEDSGTFEVVISTDDIDRSGDVIDQSGWDLTNYKNNPIVLYGHDYQSLPIGVTDNIEVVGNKLIAKGRFAPADANPFAQQVRKLYDLGILRTTSVGFIVKEITGKKITKQELLEYSFVPVPCNAQALSLRELKEMDIDVAMLKVKGIDLKVKEEETPAEIIEEEIEEPEEVKEEIENKGEISDYINAEGHWDEKWNNLDDISYLIDVFYRIYLDKRTPVEDFAPLLLELAQLITDFANAETVETKSVVSEKMAAFKSKTEDTTEFVVKAGARLSAKSLEVLNEILTNHKNLNASLETFIADEAKAEETKNIPADDKQIEKRSKSTGSEKLLKGLDDYLVIRQVLRSVDNAIGGALENVNKSIREKSQKK